jgi:hypothetical protein
MMAETFTHTGEAKPLVNWSNPPTLRALKQDLMDAKSTHDAQVTKIEGWLDNLKVTGAAKVVTPVGNSKIVPKLIRKQAEWRYSALSEPFLSTQDLFNVAPVTWEDRDAAKQNELILNHQFNVDIDKTTFIDEFVRTAVDEGTVIVRTGWEFAEEQYEEEVAVYDFKPNPEIAETLQQVQALQAENPTRFDIDVPEALKQALKVSMHTGMPMEPIEVGSRMEKKVRTVYNRPTINVCDFRNVIIDPTCFGDVEKASFVIYSFESSLSQLEKDGRYKNLDRINVDNSSILGQPDHATTDGSKNFNFSDKPRKKFVVYEYWGYWDKDGSGVVEPIVAAWVGETLIRMEDNPFPDKKIPFVVCSYLPVRQSVYGEPDGALLEDNQKIIGAVTRGMIDIMGKSANGQTGVRKDMLDATNRRKFEKGMDYEFNTNVDPRQGIHMHTYPEIPNSAQFMLQLQNMEAESLTGVKSFSQGVSGQSLGQVAAGVRGALDAASKRELGILRRLSNAMLKIGRKLVSMNAEFLSDTEVVRVTNEEFVKIDRKDLCGAFDLRLSISTAEEDNNKAQELAFMLQTMGNSMPPDMSKMILGDIARLRKMPDLAKKIEAYEPQPDPMQQQLQQLEMMKLQEEIKLIQAKTASEMANAQLSSAKINTEGAKAGNLASDTDMKNLDFVEQETGTKQARALELHGEQARSQAQLKMLDRQFQQEDKKQDLIKEFIINKQV